VPDGKGRDTVLLLMPAWTPGGYMGVKLATVAPGNAAKGLPTVIASYLLHEAATGRPLALMDGTMLTLRRTAAASALAADYLARKDASRLVVVGTGALAPHLAEAHAAMRPIRHIAVWGRDAAKARATAETLVGLGLPAEPTTDLESAVRAADIVSCGTTSREPLVRGAWLRPGTHLDLVGGFTPAMREADDEAIRRARVFVDSDHACHEAGDLTQTGVTPVGDLSAVIAGKTGRASAEEITLFKSVGMAVEDLAAAILVDRFS
jgi:alanine dehydrogenase